MNVEPAMMRNLLIALVTLAVVSLTMRYLPSVDSPSAEPTIPRKQSRSRPDASGFGDLNYVLSAHSTPSPPTCHFVSPARANKTVFCRLYEPMDVLRTKVGAYQYSNELREDIEKKEPWIRHILLQPVERNAREVGLQIRFRTSNPFSRLGMRDGDILVSLNGIGFTHIDDLPALLNELKSSPSLHFLLERKGVPVRLNVQLL